MWEENSGKSSFSTLFLISYLGLPKFECMKIGLSFPGSDERNSFYQRWLKGKDNIDIIELSAEKNNLEQLKDCDGLVLSGGVDVHPKVYGKNTNYPHAPKNF